MKIKLAALFAVILLFGCSQRITDFTIISSKNVDLSRGADFKRGKERVTGKDVGHIIFVVPTRIPNVKQAIDRTIEGTPGAVALADGVLNHYFWYIPYIYGKETYEVEGTPLIDPKLLKDIQ